ncbi:uncharacterized protein FOMMEDRAFT_136418 [Fomitiporia mediterranea MF3/22]|uniref:uncharacterized protein n=1 Tax=Fomitiporia mediterranea (strain MF3/22) TaxID=694068 RepID=UPI00044074D6|nr:uncharacterized protein FOMMEDRAFT_136418 [Fomitiporia mediterranea MF3/22]EJC99812.1 hypothetical protein FOMMEDRAFT_136418 [Fomitiporia mediterranea MF3/22]
MVVGYRCSWVRCTKPEVRRQSADEAILDENHRAWEFDAQGANGRAHKVRHIFAMNGAYFVPDEENENTI